MERHTRRTYGKTTAEANYYKATLRPKRSDPERTVGGNGETEILPKPDFSLRQRFDHAVLAYRAEGDHRGTSYTAAARELDECILLADAAGWGSAAIGRRLYGGVNGSGTGYGAIKRARRRLAQHPLPETIWLPGLPIAGEDYDDLIREDE